LASCPEADVANKGAGRSAATRIDPAIGYPRGVDPGSLRACRVSIEEATVELTAIIPSELDGAAERAVVFETPSGPLAFSGGAYLMSFAFPNFYFHASIAYALLRSRGLPIGKNDFLRGV
jgi:uncharacterized protein